MNDSYIQSQRIIIPLMEYPLPKYVSRPFNGRDMVTQRKNLRQVQ